MLERFGYVGGLVHPVHVTLDAYRFTHAVLSSEEASPRIYVDGACRGICIGVILLVVRDLLEDDGNIQNCRC